MDRAKLKETFSWDHRWVRWCSGFAIWTLLGLSFAVRSYLSALQSNLDVSWKHMISAYLADFYSWGLVSPLIFRLAKRFELLKRLPINLLIHLGLSAVFSFVCLTTAALAYWYIGYPNFERTPTLRTVFGETTFSVYYFHFSMTIYWTTLIFFLMIRRPPRSTLFPYTTLSRARRGRRVRAGVRRHRRVLLLRRRDLGRSRSEEHTSELQSRENLVCRLLLEKKKKRTKPSKSREKKKIMQKHHEN